MIDGSAMKVFFPFFRFTAILAALLIPCPGLAVRLRAPLDYQPSIPHSDHIATMLTDFRYDQTPAEYDWTAAHYDRVMGGKIAEYRQRNPAMKYYVYALNLSLIRESAGDPPEIFTAYYNDMKNWYAAHSEYKIEDAFLHDGKACPASREKTEACRIQVSWAAHARWIPNPGDAGLRAYDADRLRRAMLNVQGSGYNADGIFFDEHASGDFSHWRSLPIREYPEWNRYEDDVVGLLASERKGIGKLIQINTSEFITSIDQRMILAGGAAHMELSNNPLSDWLEERWKFVDTLLQKGAFVETVNAYSWGEAATLKLSPGNQPTGVLRLKMAELCSYYMVVPSSPVNMALFMSNNGWDVPHSKEWLRALEVNVGHPVGPRVLAFEGKDANGKAVRVWRREFERALVFMRSKTSWDYNDYGDGTQVSLALPAGERWYPLHSDGSLGLPVTSVTLRNPEGMIFLKGSMGKR